MESRHIHIFQRELNRNLLGVDFRKVYGVEVIPQAIEDARENARRNGIRNAEFFTGKAEEVLPAFYERKRQESTAEGSPDKRKVEKWKKSVHSLSADNPASSCPAHEWYRKLYPFPREYVFLLP